MPETFLGKKIKNGENWRARKELEREEEALRDFFKGEKGKEYLKRLMNSFGIHDFWEPHVLEIDNVDEEHRLIVRVSPDDFLGVVCKIKPETIRYRVTTIRDVETNGDVLWVVNEKVAIQASVVLYYNVGQQPEGFLDKLKGICPYEKASEIKRPAYFDPAYSWYVLALKWGE